MQVQTTHNNIAAEISNLRRKEMQQHNENMLGIRVCIKESTDPLEKKHQNEDYGNAQREMSHKLEAKDSASCTRISNFYKLNTGKNVPITFQCIKEKNKS